METMRWVPVPNKHDGDGLTALLDHPNAAAHYGAWHMILQVASKCQVRGTLLRATGQPHDSKSLSRMTRLPRAVFDEVIPRLLSDEIGWMETVDTDGVVKVASVGRQAPDGLSTMEGNGIEGNRRTPQPPVGGSVDDLDYQRLVESPHFRSVTYQQYLEVLRCHPLANPSSAVDASLADAESQSRGLTNPERFLKSRFSIQEMKTTGNDGKESNI